MKEQETNEEEFDIQSLVGRKVILEVTERVRGEGENKTVYESYKVNDPQFVEEVNNISTNNRIFPPGTGGTMDYQMFRLNVYIDENGIVTDVSYG